MQLSRRPPCRNASALVISGEETANRHDGDGGRLRRQCAIAWHRWQGRDRGPAGGTGDGPKAAKRGLVVRVVPFTDDFVRGIMEIYDETPVRQGRLFWHYKKGFDEVKRANSTYVERSDFVGAYVGDELVGFLKIVYVDRFARLMQIIAKDAQRNRRPMNALIAKAVEVIDAKGCSLLTYGNFRYAQGADSVTAFKVRNGFEEIMVPKYYVPLTAKGKLALRMHLHHGVRAWVPNPVRQALKRARLSLYQHTWLTRKDR